MLSCRIGNFTQSGSKFIHLNSSARWKSLMECYKTIEIVTAIWENDIFMMYYNIN